MQPTKLEDRPPFVTFETRSLEDRGATLASGHYVGTDVDYAFITPAGSKDRIERVVKDWFEKLDEDLLQERIPPHWVKSYKDAYDAFKQGKEAPVSGYPIINWPGLSPSQVKTLVSLNLRAVEDVAAANEETIARLGMGARALKQRAIDFLATAQNVGKVAEQASASRAEAADLAERNKSLEDQVRALQAQVAAMAVSQPPQTFQPPQSHGITADDLLGADPL